jgi:gelsolin
MTGLVKPKEYDWKDSNLALFGSDTEKSVKKESAECEPAWQGAGQEVGIQIWRINKFKVEHWPKEDYGSFYNGDSYIILNTYKEKESDELLYDLHFWIGSKSTQDEYGTAAYKTVELDTFLDDKPVQHREVEGHESKKFKSYFKSFRTMSGGVDSGFNHVTPEEYVPRLLKVSGEGNKVKVTEVAYNKCCVTEDDVYIIDKGNKIYQYNGPSCNIKEKYKGTTEVQAMKGKRGKASSEVVESLSHPCFHDLSDEALEQTQADDEPDSRGPSITKLSDETGELVLDQISSDDPPSRSLLSSADVFIVDTSDECFVWIGKGASENESQNGFTYAHNYLKKRNDAYKSVTVLKEGKESKEFFKATTA